MVAYATPVKEQVLGVPRSVVERHGVVSRECAEAMAEGVRTLTGATFGASTTGVAGPDSQDGKPPGTVWVAVAGPDGIRTRQLTGPGTREEVQDRTVDAVLDLLATVLGTAEPGLR